MITELKLNRKNYNIISEFKNEKHSYTIELDENESVVSSLIIYDKDSKPPKDILYALELKDELIKDINYAQLRGEIELERSI